MSDATDTAEEPARKPAVRTAQVGRLRADGLSVTWFRSWHTVLDEALRSLPETQLRPHDLLRELASTDVGVPKRTALVAHQGSPVAVVPLRRTGHSWEPVTAWSVPGEPFPTRLVDVVTVAQALRRSVYLPWWRMGDPPAVPSHVGWVDVQPTYEIDLTGDWEQHWRAGRHWKHVRQSRSRCARYGTVVNHPAAVEWVLTGSERLWRPVPSQVDPALADRLRSTQYLDSKGYVLSVCLLDEGWPIAGSVSLVEGDNLVAFVVYRDRRYDRDSVGVRLADLRLQIAAERGLRTMDLGGGYEYKRRWGPQKGVRADVLMAPATQLYARQAREVARRWTGAARLRCGHGGGNESDGADAA